MDVQKRCIKNAKKNFPETRFIYGSIDYFKPESSEGDENLEETQKDNFNGHLNGLVGTPDKIIQKLEELAKLDVSFIINIFPEKDKIESLTLFRDEVLPAFK